MSDILLSPSEWDGTGATTQTGSQNNDDITNDVNVAIQSLNNALNAVGFMDNAKNFVTVMEEFGEGIEAVLACISVDLAVVSSGVKAAATAFSSLDAKLSSTFAQMDKQLGYFTNTTSSVTLATPTAEQENSLLSLLNKGTPNSYSPGIHLSAPSSTAMAGAAGLGLVGALLLVGLAFA